MGECFLPIINISGDGGGDGVERFYLYKDGVFADGYDDYDTRYVTFNTITMSTEPANNKGSKLVFNNRIPNGYTRLCFEFRQTSVLNDNTSFAMRCGICSSKPNGTPGASNETTTNKSAFISGCYYDVNHTTSNGRIAAVINIDGWANVYAAFVGNMTCTVYRIWLEKPNLHPPVVKVEDRVLDTSKNLLWGVDGWKRGYFSTSGGYSTQQGTEREVLCARSVRVEPNTPYVQIVMQSTRSTDWSGCGIFKDTGVWGSRVNGSSAQYCFTPTTSYVIPTFRTYAQDFQIALCKQSDLKEGNVPFYRVIYDSTWPQASGAAPNAIDICVNPLE